MLQIQFINQHKAAAIAGLSKRGLQDAEALVNQAIELDELRRKAQTEHDQAQAEANQKAKMIGKLKAQGDEAAFEAAKKETSALKAKTKELAETQSKHEEALQALLLTLPNLPHESVPNGQGEQDNEVLEQIGDLPELAANALPHWDIIQKLDIIDFELGNKITGAGFPVYKGKGARLQRSLVNFFLDQAREAGYLEIQPPLLVNEDSGYGTGQLPDKDGQMYVVNRENLFLIPTAEVPITNLYRNEIIDESTLPIKNVGYTPCFRREAGSWGADVRGLNRLHQFDKVEIVQIQHPEHSYETLEEMRRYAQSLLEQLELPYRVLRLCAGDLGFTSALTYDLEVYSAAQKRWLEVSSVSNFETFQANRLGLRYRDAQNKKQTLHTLNGSALALPRIMAAIIENNQTEGGTIKIPKVLHSYTGFSEID